jgi:2-oxopent-4-enoate/cis-2-oxohex-4-enoate hydratase
VAFVLKSDLMGPGVTAADVLRATDAWCPASRSSTPASRTGRSRSRTPSPTTPPAACWCSAASQEPGDIDLALAGMVLEKNGEIISTSTGAAVQGSPVNAVAWLANTLGRLGIGLKAGEVILSGSQSPLVPVKAGDSLVCTVGGLGGTSVRFI